MTSDQNIKYKAGGMIISTDKQNLLFTVEMPSEEDKKANKPQKLLTPGGTVGDNLVFKDQVDRDFQVYKQLLVELDEEISLEPDQYKVEKLFNAKQMLDNGVLLDMDCYMIDLNSDAKIIPNYKEGDENHEVYLAIWVNMNDLIEIAGHFKLKKNRVLIGIDTSGEKIVLNSNGFFLTPMSEAQVIPELKKRKLFVGENTEVTNELTKNS